LNADLNAAYNIRNIHQALFGMSLAGGSKSVLRPIVSANSPNYLSVRYKPSAARRRSLTEKVRN
jgi:hypothetical protein